MQAPRTCWTLIQGQRMDYMWPPVTLQSGPALAALGLGVSGSNRWMVHPSQRL